MNARTGTPDEIESQICEQFDALISDEESQRWTTTEWTKQLKSAVAKLGKDRKFWVYANGCELSDGGEFLVDLCWLEYNGSTLVNIPLVLESEWAPSGASDDFQKLTMLRADHRVMVFAVTTETDRDEAFQTLLAHVNSCKHSLADDRYLLCCWKNEERGFDHRAYIVESGAG